MYVKSECFSPHLHNWCKIECIFYHLQGIMITKTFIVIILRTHLFYLSSFLLIAAKISHLPAFILSLILLFVFIFRSINKDIQNIFSSLKILFISVILAIFWYKRNIFANGSKCIDIMISLNVLYLHYITHLSTYLLSSITNNCISMILVGMYEILIRVIIIICINFYMFYLVSKYS